MLPEPAAVAGEEGGLDAVGGVQALHEGPDAPAVGADRDAEVASAGLVLVGGVEGGEDLAPDLAPVGCEILLERHGRPQLLIHLVVQIGGPRSSTRFCDTLCTGAPGSESGFSQQAAAELRAASVRYPTDNVLAELINEFATHDPVFAGSWSDHAVRLMPSMRKNLHHPTLGELEIDRHILGLPGADFSLVMYTAEAGSSSAAALNSH
ncbi:MmyB family transcriptional regulator [Streptomyces anulatus]